MRRFMEFSVGCSTSDHYRNTSTTTEALLHDNAPPHKFLEPEMSPGAAVFEKESNNK